MMFLASVASQDTLAAVIGYTAVVLVLAAVAAIAAALVKRFVKKGSKAAEAVQTVPAAEPVSEEPKPVAPGSAGELKLHDVEPKTAAMLMAIVADKLGKPLNELRFISIKEVK